MDGLGAGFLILLGLAALLVFYGIAVYNGLVAGRNQIEAAWGQIDVQLKRRHDLIPNLVEVAKDYMSYEQETLQQVIAARRGAVAAEGGPREAAIGAEGILGAALGKLFALVENYPDLKANENVQRLMEELSTTENRIAFARQHYNDSVMSQNTRVEKLSLERRRQRLWVRPGALFRGAGGRNPAGQGRSSLRPSGPWPCRRQRIDRRRGPHPDVA